ncbi:MAG TPA: gliding motility-associated C-terminal domain-containing protein, partial [Flavipsychrobacter sp.]
KGMYQLSISYEGCIDSDVIIVTQYPALQIDLGTDAELCNGGELVLANLSRSHEGVKYLWQDGATTEEYSITKPGQYFLTINNVCDTLTDTVIVTERNCRFFFPSAFTPNGDGNNDIARLVGDIGVIEHYQLRIFNRWGEEVFFTDNVHKGWDGFYNGVSAEMGTYFYQIQYTYQAERELMKGNLLLIH